MGDERAGAPDNPSPEQQQRLEAARSLLERNGELVFKLNGLAALRRTSGGRPPSAEERALLAQAQRSLQDAASLLPPQILVPAATTKQLRRQLESAAAAAAGEPGCHKRRLIITHIKEGQADGRQAAMDGLHLEEALARAAQGDHREEDMEQLEGMLFPSHAQPALEGQQGQRPAGEAPPPPPPPQQQQQQSQQQQSQQQQQQSQQQQQQQQQQHSQQQRQDQAAEGSSGAPPEGALSLSALAGSPQQQPTGGMLSQAFLHGLRPQSSLGDLVGGGGSARLSADLGLLPVAALNGGLGSMGMGAGQQAQPRPGASLLGGERLAGEDAYLLSKAYSSMSTEQKERLAAQPPEVRHFVLRERMRRTKQQLAQMQAQPAAGSGATTPPAPPSRPASGPPGVQGAQWEGMQPVGQPQDWAPGAYQSTSPAPPPGEQQGSGVQQQQQRPFSWQQQAQMQQAQMQQQQAQQPSASLQPDQGFTADSQLLQQEQQQQQQQRGLPLGLASLRQLSPAGLAGLQQMGAQLPGGLSGLGALLRGSLAGGASEAAAAGPGADGGPFVALNEEQRLEHLRSLKRRQEEWLQQQRLAAARLAQPGSG